MTFSVGLTCSWESSSEYSSQEEVVEAEETVLLPPPLRITVLEDAAETVEVIVPHGCAGRPPGCQSVRRAALTLFPSTLASSVVSDSGRTERVR